MLKLFQRKGQAAWYMRGAWRGITVYKTTGTASYAEARRILAATKRDIERRALEPRPVKPPAAAPTFAEAALAYLDAGGSDRFLGRFDPVSMTWSAGPVSWFGETPVDEIDQAKIDKAAIALYPHAGNATRNRQFYTPVSAILTHAGHGFRLKRPKGAQGRQRTEWLKPAQAFRLFKAARSFDPEFAGLLVFLCYTGARLSDALNLKCDDLILAESYCEFARTKNGDPRGVYLPPVLVAELANHPRGTSRPGERVFRFRKCGRLYSFMKRARQKAGPDLAFVTFHTFCHTWATWMRRYGETDLRGLVGTGRWRDEKSVARYQHVALTEESRRADLLPVPDRKAKG